MLANCFRRCIDLGYVVHEHCTGRVLIAGAGTDSMLVEIVKAALVKAGWLTTVKTGSLMFDLGDNDRLASLTVGS
jgi:hypothetical protein